MQVGLIGLGRMGMAIATRLAEHGYGVIGWDVDAPRLREAEAHGLRAGADPADVASRSDVILSIVTDDAAVDRIFNGPGGALEGHIEGKLFVEMSTLRPAFVRDLAATLHPRGAGLIGAPVLGSIPTVRDGKLLVLAGGAAADNRAGRGPCSTRSPAPCCMSARSGPAMR